MTRNRIAPRRAARFAVEQLEDRAVPAQFTSATFTFEQNSTPDTITALAPGTYDAAVVTGTPTTTTATVGGFPDSTTGFNSQLSLGSLVSSTGLPKALQLDETTTRSGVQLSWSGGQGLANASGDDLVFYETEPGSTPTAQPEAFMVQVHDATTGSWSMWYYEPADSAAAVTIGGSAATVFATSIDLSNLGLANGDVIDAVRVVNMTAADRMLSSTGVGQVLPGDGGATSSFTPSAGTLGLASTFSPEMLYAGAVNALTNPLVDVKVTKTDNTTVVAAGQQVQYTIVVSNTGANAASGTAFTDNLPSGLTNVSWTSSTSTGVTGSAGSGTGSISETLSLPAGSSITYTVTAKVSATATGTVANTASATVSNTLTDVNTANNSATDTDTVAVPVDLSISKTDNLKFVYNGGPTTYTIVVTNVGTNPVTGAQVVDNLTPELKNATWTSTSSGGATGSAGSGTGAINEMVNLPVGASVTYTVQATVTGGARGGLTNTATVTAPSGEIDTNLGNNTASDRDTVLPKPVPAYLHQFLSAAGNGLVSLFDTTGRLVAQAFPFASFGYTGPVHLAVGDLTGDGVEDFVFTAAQGPLAGLVEVVDGASLTLLGVTFVFPGFSGPVNVAIGDIDGDGTNDLILATGAGGGMVEAFNLVTRTQITSFTVLPGFTGGLTVTAGDVNGDGVDEIIVGFASGLPVVAVYDGTGALLDAFLAYPLSYLGGVNVAAGDILGNDGVDEILVAPLSGGTNGLVELFEFQNHTPVASANLPLFGAGRGLNVALRDVDGDGDLDFVFAPGNGQGRGSRVLAFNSHSGKMIRDFDLFPDSIGGVEVD